MKIKDVVVGGTYLTRVGPDLVRVEVTGRNPVPGYSNRHDRFWVKNLRTGNQMRRTAAALRREASRPCGSGWTNDRCIRELGHGGSHSNED